MSLKEMPLPFTFFISGLNSQSTTENFNGMLLFIHVSMLIQFHYSFSMDGIYYLYETINYVSYA